MAEKKISYTTRDFQGIRTELINFTRQYYPDLVQNFNDAGIFSVFLDLNAAVTDNLQFHIDRSISKKPCLFSLGNIFYILRLRLVFVSNSSKS